MGNENEVREIEIESRDEYPYAIGNADYLGIVVPGGVWDVEYDLKQVRDEGDDVVKFAIEGRRTFGLYEKDIAIGDHISVSVARGAVEVTESDRFSVVGFVVPDEYLYTFLEEFPEMEIYRAHRTGYP